MPNSSGQHAEFQEKMVNFEYCIVLQRKLKILLSISWIYCRFLVWSRDHTWRSRDLQSNS